MRHKNLRSCLHSNIKSALWHPSVWAGFAGVLTSTGAELEKPYSTCCFIVSALCSAVAIIIRTPQDQGGVLQEEGACTASSGH